MNISFEDIPHTIVQYIFGYLSPYTDLMQCSLVNRTWYELVKATLQSITMDLGNALVSGKLCWEHMNALSTRTIPARFAHSSCVTHNSMFVYGGHPMTQPYSEDLWRLDLESRSWTRVRPTGDNPTPKARSSMVYYRDNLILFGGWGPPYADSPIVNHLHIYSITKNSWSKVITSTVCPGMTGHTASMIGSKMIVFGGLQNGPLTSFEKVVNFKGSDWCTTPIAKLVSSDDQTQISDNHIWVFDTTSMSWKKHKNNSPTPLRRYGHSQITIDSQHLIIMGGCDGSNRIFDDLWLLETSQDPDGIWEWKKIKIAQKEYSAPQLAFHQACKV